MRIIKTCLLGMSIIGICGCSNLIVNNKYIQDTGTVAPMHLPAGQKAQGIKAAYPVPATSAAGKKMPNLFPPGV